MDKLAMTEAVISKKLAKDVSWETIATAVGVSPVWLASVCLGKNSASPEQAKAIAAYLDLDANVQKALTTFPTKIWDQTVATDPLIYRFYEIAGVYGDSIKEVVQEEFGDGIMSAIDFSCDVERVADPKGDRVKIIMEGKFLPYKSW